MDALAKVVGGRSARKREAIKREAAALFLQKGYLATSMDEVAARAGVSKQTVYKNFVDKERLFSEIVLSNAATAAGFGETVAELLANPDDLAGALHELGRRYIRTVIDPSVLELRRLLIGEAERFPGLARNYYEHVIDATMSALAARFGDLANRGYLAIDDPILAANHFAWLIIGEPVNKAMFWGDDEAVVASDLDRFADAGVDAFLVAYAPPHSQPEGAARLAPLLYSSVL